MYWMEKKRKNKLILLNIIGDPIFLCVESIR